MKTKCCVYFLNNMFHQEISLETENNLKILFAGNSSERIIAQIFVVILLNIVLQFEPSIYEYLNPKEKVKYSHMH